MNVVPTPLAGLVVLEPRVFSDSRGFFLETFNLRSFGAAGLPAAFAQTNWSRSIKNTLRGLHFQEPNPQGKLVWVAQGAVWDVAVDVRRGSPTFGQWHGVELSADNKRLYYVPEGFAHGFCVLSETADFFYQCTRVYSGPDDRGIAWNDPDLAIAWPVKEPLLSPKDAAAPRLKDAPVLPGL